MNFFEIEFINNWYFNIKLPYIEKDRLSYNQDSLKYLYHIKRYVKDVIKAYLFEEELPDGEFVFQIGYLSLIYELYKDKFDSKTRSEVESRLFSNLQLPKFDNLFEYQNSDLQELCRYNRGIFQCYTGYGKSQIISTLATHLSSIGKKVLILTHSGAAKDEIYNRLLNLFEVDLGIFDYSRNLNLINVNGFFRSGAYKKDEQYWNELDCILSDEVENTISETAMEFYESLPNIQLMYGFSATSDKKFGEPLYSDPNKMDIKQLKDTLGRNKFLVGYYDSTKVFKKPNDFKIRLVNVRSTISKDDIQLPAEYQYSEIIYDLYTSDSICKLIESIAYKVGLIFIPMFRLEVIDFWMKSYFNKFGYCVLIISSRGYEVYISGKYKGNVTMPQIKKMVSDGIVDLILGTKSSYNALDLPELTRCLLLYSKSANIVIQAIGRASRSKNIEIYNIIPIKSIPVYSKDLSSRMELIQSYYSDCSILESNVNENIYG